MLHKNLISLVFGWVLMMSVTAYAAVTVAVPEEVTVTTPYFTLADIATITGDDEDKIKILGSCRLGTSPLPGASLTLTPGVITMRLAGQSVDLSDVEWQLPPLIKVTTASQSVSGTVLEEQAIAAVQKYLTIADNEVKAVKHADVILPAGTVQYKVDFPTGVRFSEPVTARIIISVNGQPYRQEAVKLMIDVYQNIVIINRAMQKGEVVSATDLTLERRSVGKLGSYYTDKSKVAGFSVKRALAAGTVMTETMLDMPQVIKSGAIVSVVARIGDVEAATTGRALENGKVNQLIRVQNLQSKKIITAKVIDANRVEVTAG